MPWVRIDDHFDEHPKMARVGPLGWGLWLAGIAYCNRNLTDGFIPWSVAHRLCSFEVIEDDGRIWDISRTSNIGGEDVDARWVIGLLIDAGIWEEVGNGKGRIDGYRIHDYDQYQPSKEQVLAEREANAKRQADFRERRKDNANSNGVTNELRNGVSNAPVTDMSQAPRTRTRMSSNEDIGAKAPADSAEPLEPLDDVDQSINGRRSGEVYALVDAFVLGKGLARGDLVGRARKTAYNALANAPPWTTADDVRECTSYFMTDPFWEQPRKLTAQIVVEGLAEWRNKGRPVAIPLRSRNGRPEGSPELDHEKYQGANYLKVKGS